MFWAQAPFVTWGFWLHSMGHDLVLTLPPRLHRGFYPITPQERTEQSLCALHRVLSRGSPPENYLLQGLIGLMLIDTFHL